MTLSNAHSLIFKGFICYAMLCYNLLTYKDWFYLLGLLDSGGSWVCSLMLTRKGFAGGLLYSDGSVYVMAKNGLGYVMEKNANFGHLNFVNPLFLYKFSRFEFCKLWQSNRFFFGKDNYV
jgi:hypothetical protein